MSITLEVETNLIAEQDVLFGSEPVLQTRSGSAFMANPIRMIKIVDDIQALKLADPGMFDIAIVKDIGEMYFYNPTATEAENIPFVVMPNKITRGRWIRTLLGDASVRRSIVAELEKGIAELQENIAPVVRDVVSQEIPTSLNRILAKGFEFSPNVPYKHLDYVKVFVEDKGTLTERTYVISKQDQELETTPLQNGPVSGDVKETANGTTIYVANDNLVENEGYERVFVGGQLIKEISVEADKNYEIFKTNHPKGTLKCRTKKNGAITSYFEIVFSGISPKNFNIRHVQYAPTIQLTQVEHNYGLVYYPGFALRATAAEFSFSVANIDQCDTLEVDYAEMDVAPSLNKVAFTSDRSYAIREGGGSFIPGLGSIIPCIRDRDIQSGESFSFYQFMTGRIVWERGLELNTDLYHQFASGGFPSLDVDTVGMFLRHKTADASIGELRQAQLPNIKGFRGNTAERDSAGNLARSMTDGGPAHGTAGAAALGDWRGAFYMEQKTPREVGIGDTTSFASTQRAANSADIPHLYLGFDASRHDPTYADDGEVRPKSLNTLFMLQLF